jgi:UDP-glucose 4-epimerase
MIRNLPKIVITGASGFIGKNVVNYLKDNYTIFAIARRSSTEAEVPFHINIHWIQWDIAKIENIKEIISLIKTKGGADYFIHLAGFYDFDYDDNPEYERTNVIGTENALKLAKHLDVERFIFASSLAACQFPKEGEFITEQSEANANFKYAKTKKKGEELVQNYSNWFPCTVVRFAAIYSDWCEYAPLYKFLETWLTNNWNSRILGGKGNSAVSYLHIHDLIKFLLKIIDQSNQLPKFDIYNASPNGYTTHKSIYNIATRDFYGSPKKVILMPKIIALIGVIMRDLLGKFKIINRPFEKPWMIKYIDLKLNIDSNYTQKQLDWKPTTRYKIERRLLFLLVNMKTHNNEWILKNEAALKHASSRPNYIIYEFLVKEENKLVRQITEKICALENKSIFLNYQRLPAHDIQKYMSSLYHLIMGAVRSGDRSLMINYVDEISIDRFSIGFEPKEIINALSVFSEIIINDLTQKKELKKLKQEVYDYIGLTIQIAQDEVEDVYENLEQQLSPQKIIQLNQLNASRSRQKMIKEFAAFYQNFPSG